MSRVSEEKENSSSLLTTLKGRTNLAKAFIEAGSAPSAESLASHRQARAQKTDENFSSCQARAQQRFIHVPRGENSSQTATTYSREHSKTSSSYMSTLLQPIS